MREYMTPVCGCGKKTAVPVKTVGDQCANCGYYVTYVKLNSNNRAIKPEPMKRDESVSEPLVCHINIR